MGDKIIDISGQRFGRYLVLRRAPSQKRPDRRTSTIAMWLCLCDCGAEKAVRGTHLRSGKILSCGCLRDERAAKANRTHGKTGTPEHKTWASMFRRCYNQNQPGYREYGARGITVCDRWRSSFEAFFIDMGPKPTPSHSIDRIDGAKGYEPGNCRWATAREQGNNRRGLRAVAGCTSIAEAARKFGINEGTLRSRLNRGGWTVQRALTELTQTPMPVDS